MMHMELRFSILVAATLLVACDRELAQLERRGSFAATRSARPGGGAAPAPVAARPGDERFVVGAGALAERGIELTVCAQPPCRADPRTTSHDLAQGMIVLRDPDGGPPSIGYIAPRAIVVGGMKHESVARLLRGSLAAFHACYPPALDANESRVTISFEIDAFGWPINVESVPGESDALGTTVADPALVACVVRATWSLSFAPTNIRGIRASFSLVAG
jgi:hypothetical protein